jgi:hypothetical protein
MKLNSLVRIGTGAMAALLLSTASAPAASSGRLAPPARKVAPVLILVHARRMSPPSCPSEFSGCISITAASPYTAEWCISSTGNCSSGLVSSATWTATNFKVKNGKTVKNTKAFSSVWSPNPGNPSNLTVSTDKAQAKGKVKYGLALSVCYSGGCFSDFWIVGFQI